MSTITIVLKQPSGVDLEVTVEKKSNITQLKQLVSEKHPDKPSPSKQRIIFSGRILNDNEVIEQLFNAQHDLSQPQKFHLVVRKEGQPTTQGPSSPNPVPNQYPYPPYQFPQNAPPPNFAYPQGFNYQNQWNFPQGQPQVPQGPHQGPHQVPQGPHQVPQVPHQGPPQGQPWGQGYPYYAPPQYVPRANQRYQGVHVARINIDGGLILKLALLIYICGQGGGTERIALLIALGIAYYLYQTGVRANQQQGPNNQGQQNAHQQQNNAPQNNEQPQQNVQQNANQNQPNLQANQNQPQQADLQQPRPAQNMGIVSEVLGFFVPLVMSLNPSWQNPEPRQQPPQPQPQPQPNQNNNQ